MSAEREELILVDLDGTLAKTMKGRTPLQIGAPVPRMVARVKRWLSEGKDVRIFTARVSPVSLKRNEIGAVEMRMCIESWCKTHIGQRLPITCEKDYRARQIWDDRAVQVEADTGNRIEATLLTALIEVTDLLERIGDSRKDRPLIEKARSAIAQSHHP